MIRIRITTTKSTVSAIRKKKTIKIKIIAMIRKKMMITKNTVVSAIRKRKEKDHKDKDYCDDKKKDDDYEEYCCKCYKKKKERHHKDKDHCDDKKKYDYYEKYCKCYKKEDKHHKDKCYEDSKYKNNNWRDVPEDKHCGCKHDKYEDNYDDYEEDDDYGYEDHFKKCKSDYESSKRYR